MDEQNNVSQQEAPVQDNPEVSSAQTEKEKVRSSKNKKVWTLAALIVAAVVVMLAIAGVLVGVYRYNSPEAVAVRYVETMDKDNEKAASLLAYDEKAKLLYNYDGDQTAFLRKMRIHLIWILNRGRIITARKMSSGLNLQRICTVNMKLRLKQPGQRRCPLSDWKRNRENCWMNWRIKQDSIGMQFRRPKRLQ